MRWTTFRAANRSRKEKVSILPGAIARSLPSKRAISRTPRGGSAKGSSNSTAVASAWASDSTTALRSSTGSGLPFSSTAIASAIRCFSPIGRSRGSQATSTTSVSVPPADSRRLRRRGCGSARSGRGRCSSPCPCAATGRDFAARCTTRAAGRTDRRSSPAWSRTSSNARQNGVRSKSTFSSGSGGVRADRRRVSMIRFPLCSCNAASAFESGIAGLCSVIGDARVADSAAILLEPLADASQSVPHLRGGVFGWLGQQCQCPRALLDELFLGRVPLGQRRGIQLVGPGRELPPSARLASPAGAWPTSMAPIISSEAVIDSLPRDLSYHPIVLRFKVARKLFISRGAGHIAARSYHVARQCGKEFGDWHANCSRW